jgi:hypothetical protein
MRRSALLACAVTALLTAACGHSGSTDTPAGTKVVPVATWRIEGGLLPSGLPQLNPPRLAMYRDGRAIADAAHVIRLTPSEVSGLVKALTGDLKAVPSSPSPPGTVLDAPTTVITAGRLRVRAVGIDVMRGYPRSLYDARDRLADLARRAIAHGTAYASDRIRLVTRPAQPSGRPIRTWPSGAPAPDASRVQATDLSGGSVRVAVRSIDRDTERRGDWAVYRLPGGGTVAASWRYLLPGE